MNKGPGLTMILVVLLIILFEYQLITWTQRYGTDHDVVSHVGFAGTIVSIILALVAIFYSYYQGFAQQRDAQALAQQLSVLRDLGANLTKSGQSIASSGAELQDVREQLRYMLEISKRTEQSTAETLAHVKQAQSPPQPRPPEPLPGLDPGAVASRLVETATPKQLAIYEALCYASDKGLTTREYAGLVSAVVKKRLQVEGKGDIAENLGEWADGIASGYGELLEDLGLAFRQRQTGTKRPAKITVAPQFRERVLAATGIATQPAPRLIIDVPSVRQEIAERESAVTGTS
jgi:type II secretory pathway pseudopilin PulG